MDLSSKNEAYRNYVEQGKEAFSQGDIQRAKTLFLKAPKQEKKTPQIHPENKRQAKIP